MIYLRLHQARSEEVEVGASRSNRGNFAIIVKFRYNSEIFAIIAKFRYNSEIFAMHSNFST